MSFQYGTSLSYTHKTLKSGDYTIRPFEVNKLWTISSDISDYEYYENFGIKVYRAFYPENHRYFGNVATISSSMYQRVFTTQSIDPKVLWYYLDHNFYTEYDKNKQPLNITNQHQITYLAESSSVFVIPTGVFGEGLKKNSVVLTNYSQSTSYKLIDDGVGNLRDTDFDESKFVNEGDCIFYLGFNEKYREYNMVNNKLDYVLDMSPANHEVKLYNTKKIKYHGGIPISGSTTTTGVAASLNGAYMKVGNQENFNFSGIKDFAFSFWIKVPNNQLDNSLGKNFIFNKNLVQKVYSINETSLEHTYQETVKESREYPFDIYYNNASSAYPGKLSFKQSSGIGTVEVISSVLTPDTWYHVLCQKSGSNYQIWLNGQLDSTSVATLDDNVGNNNAFFIGGSPLSSSLFSGSLDEIRIYKNSIPADKVPYLYQNTLKTGYAYQTSRVGNVFYGNGFFVISDPRPKYANAFLGYTGNFDYAGTATGFRGEFRGTTTFYEYEVICKIRKNEFNFTQNSSVRTDRSLQNERLEGYVLSSSFNPYITTVGLYNDSDELVAIAKLANPLEKRDDVDMNIIVRFDM